MDFSDGPDFSASPEFDEHVANAKVMAGQLEVESGQLANWELGELMKNKDKVVINFPQIAKEKELRRKRGCEGKVKVLSDTMKLARATIRALNGFEARPIIDFERLREHEELFQDHDVMRGDQCFFSFQNATFVSLF